MGSTCKSMTHHSNGKPNKMTFPTDSYRILQKTKNNYLFSDPNTFPQVMHDCLINSYEDDIPGLPAPELLFHSPTNIDGDFTISPVLTSSYYNQERRINWCNERPAGVYFEQHQLANSQLASDVKKAIQSILFIAGHIKKDDEETNVCHHLHVVDLFSSFLKSIINLYLLFIDYRRLEIRCNGFGSFISLDFHINMSDRNMRYHFSCSFIV